MRGISDGFRFYPHSDKFFIAVKEQDSESNGLRGIVGIGKRDGNSAGVPVFSRSTALRCAGTLGQYALFFVDTSFQLLWKGLQRKVQKFSQIYGNLQPFKALKLRLYF